MTGDAGTGGNGGNGGAGDLSQQLADANAKIGELNKSNEELSGAKESAERQLGEANKELTGEEYLDYLERQKGGGDSKKGGEGSGFDAGADFDRATNTEVAKFVVSHVENMLKGVTDNVGKTQKALDDKVGYAFAQLDVAMTRTKYDGKDGGPSWAEHDKAIYNIAKANPSWGADQCYKQFKLEFNAAAKAETEAADAKAKEEERLITEKGGVAGSTTQEKDLTKEQAGEIAYRKAFGNKE